jgi:hypothetical protein
MKALGQNGLLKYLRSKNHHFHVKYCIFLKSVIGEHGLQIAITQQSCHG